MNKYAFLLLVLINFVSSEVPSVAEYERAKEALKNVLPRGADLPRAVRLGQYSECLFYHEFIRK